jgi:Na+/H+ antiporter NhaC
MPDVVTPGILSILPPILAIGLAIWSKQVYPSLLAGIGLVLAGIAYRLQGILTFTEITDVFMKGIGGMIDIIGLHTSLVIASVLGGGIFGDHCSPISDSTIMSSMSAGTDHIDHVRTQLPYALSVAGVTVVPYLILGVVL